MTTTADNYDQAPSVDEWLESADYPWPSGPYIPHEPEIKQDAFLWYQGLEALYGGAAGGGKSDCLLMAALQYVDVPGYAAMLMRKTYTELQLENALLDRSMKWLAHTDASWNGELRRWTFPSSATLAFGFLDKPNDRARYQSAEFQYIGMDELTQFEESDYRFMFSRLRRVAACPEHQNPPKRATGVRLNDGRLVCEYCGKEAPPASVVPVRMRAATNPGGPGHKWVYDRFIVPWEELQRNKNPEHNPDRIFIPARLQDNPHIDQMSYIQALHQLEPELAEQLLEGSWDAREPGWWMMRDPRWIDACVAKGAVLWAKYLAGEIDLPDPRAEYHGQVYEGLTGGIDWGEHTQGYMIWPLSHGGIFVPPSEVVMIERDPVETTRAFLEMSMKFEYSMAVACYDAAGAQSMRTFRTIARRVPRYRRLITRAIPFKDYKSETIGYLRVLARRTFQGEEERILAIHPANKELIRQLKAWKRQRYDSDEAWKPPKAVKTDDHGPDALVSGVAPTAREYRMYVEKEMREILAEEVEAFEVGVIEEGGVAYVRN